MSIQDELNVLCNSIYQLSGIHVCIYDDVHIITEELVNTKKKLSGHYQDFCRSIRALKNEYGDCHAACNNCDRIDVQTYASQTRKPFLHRCYIGMSEYIIPVIINDYYVGVVFLGQCAVEDRDNPEEILDRIERYGGEREKFRNLYESMTKVSSRDLIHAGKLVEIGLRSITSKIDIDKHVLDLNENASVMVLALRYINNYYQLPINASDVAKAVHVNSAYLSRLFRKKMDCGVLEFINTRRIGHAGTLLEQSTMPIHLIAEASGFSDANYFSRLFKKSHGISPQKYREEYNAHEGGYAIHQKKEVLPDVFEEITVVQIQEQLNPYLDDHN